MLFHLQPGDTIPMQGPLGYFTWREPIKDSILVATGTGIAPFRGMLQAYLENGGTREITLVFGVRYEISLLYRAEFESLAARYPNFDFRPTLSRPGEAWKGRRGHVQEHVLELLGERRDMDVYICGMKAMVRRSTPETESAGPGSSTNRIREVRLIPLALSGLFLVSKFVQYQYNLDRCGRCQAW